LYVNGGIYLDSSVILETDINIIVNTFDFVSMKFKNKNLRKYLSIIGSGKGDRLIYNALYHAYHDNNYKQTTNCNIASSHLHTIISNYASNNPKCLNMRKLEFPSYDSDVLFNNILSNHFDEIDTTPDSNKLCHIRPLINTNYTISMSKFNHYKNIKLYSETIIIPNGDIIVMNDGTNICLIKNIIEVTLDIEKARLINI
jgi:hypothetical protein